MDTDLELAIQPNTLGMHLFERVSGSMCTEFDWLSASKYFNTNRLGLLIIERRPSNIRPLVSW